MRYIALLILHCTAVTPIQTSSVEQVNEWHLARGWKNGCGYHFIVRRNGEIEQGRPVGMVGAHTYLHNQYSIGRADAGGLDMDGKPADTRTPEQKKALRELLVTLKKDYPRAVIVGHNTFSNKACPCFDTEEYADLQP